MYPPATPTTSVGVHVDDLESAVRQVVMNVTRADGGTTEVPQQTSTAEVYKWIIVRNSADCIHHPCLISTGPKNTYL